MGSATLHRHQRPLGAGPQTTAWAVLCFVLAVGLGLTTPYLIGALLFLFFAPFLGTTPPTRGARLTAQASLFAGYELTLLVVTVHFWSSWTQDGGSGLYFMATFGVLGGVTVALTMLRTLRRFPKPQPSQVTSTQS